VPRTQKPKPRPEPTSLTPPSPAVNGPVADVLTLTETAAYLRLPEADVVRLATCEGLPGRLIGSQWRFFKAAIQQWLSVSQPTAAMRKAAILEAAGAFQDDPDLEDLVEEVYRQRGRPITEDGSYRLLDGLHPEDFKK
jgi:excisionase family DNA binding protein